MDTRVTSTFLKTPLTKLIFILKNNQVSSILFIQKSNYLCVCLCLRNSLILSVIINYFYSLR